MQPEISKRVERHLDQQLGRWTRLLPWRRELAAHLEEAYETARSGPTTKPAPDDAWRRALKEFGEVREVACQLRREHWPEYLGWRLVAMVAALAAVFSIAPPQALLDLPALGFASSPAILIVLLDAFRGSTRWDSANRVGTWGCLGGAVAGFAYILTDVSNPSCLGAGMALSILSGLYCVVFFTPSRAAIVALIVASLLEVFVMLLSMHAMSVADGNPLSTERYWPQHGAFDRAFLVRQNLPILVAGVTLGLARFGLHGAARHALAIGAGVFLLSLVVMLGDMSDPSKIIGNLIVSLGVMGLAVAGCRLVSDSSRRMRRLVR